MEEPFKKLENRNHPWFERIDFSKFGIVEANQLDGLLQELLSMHPKCLLAGNPSQQEQLERHFAEHVRHSAFLEDAGLSGLGQSEANQLDGLLQELLSMHPKCLLAGNPSQQEQLERHFAEHVRHSAFLEDAGLSGLGQSEANQLDGLLQELLSMHPKCLLAGNLILQVQLERCMTGYQDSVGLLKRRKRKEYARGIEHILGITNLEGDFVDKNLEPVMRGTQFWKKISVLPGYLDYRMRETLEQKISNRESVVSTLREMRKSLEFYGLREAAADRIKRILDTTDMDQNITEENFERTKMGMEFWKKISRLPECP